MWRIFYKIQSVILKEKREIPFIITMIVISIDSQEGTDTPIWARAKKREE